jgi:DNA-directed RNA polymerase specialized sigma24 family protein
LVERLRGIAGVDASPPDFIVVTNEEHSDVLVAAAQLRPIDQEILRLTLWEELSHNDVALILGIEVGAVKQRAYRARRNLAQEYRRLTGDGQPPAARKGGGS